MGLFSVGGLDVKSQEAALRAVPDILIATPGRLIDHLHNCPSFHLSSIEVLILDEADRYSSGSQRAPAPDGSLPPCITLRGSHQFSCSRWGLCPPLAQTILLSFSFCSVMVKREGRSHPTTS